MHEDGYALAIRCNSKTQQNNVNKKNLLTIVISQGNNLQIGFI